MSSSQHINTWPSRSRNVTASWSHVSTMTSSTNAHRLLVDRRYQLFLTWQKGSNGLEGMDYIFNQKYVLEDMVISGEWCVGFKLDGVTALPSLVGYHCCGSGTTNQPSCKVGMNKPINRKSWVIREFKIWLNCYYSQCCYFEGLACDWVCSIYWRKNPWNRVWNFTIPIRTLFNNGTSRETYILLQEGE